MEFDWEYMVFGGFMGYREEGLGEVVIFLLGFCGCSVIRIIAVFWG